MERRAGKVNHDFGLYLLISIYRTSSVHVSSALLCFRQWRRGRKQKTADWESACAKINRGGFILDFYSIRDATGKIGPRHSTRETWVCFVARCTAADSSQGVEIRDPRGLQLKWLSFAIGGCGVCKVHANTTTRLQHIILGRELKVQVMFHLTECSPIIHVVRSSSCSIFHIF